METDEALRILTTYIDHTTGGDFDLAERALARLISHIKDVERERDRAKELLQTTADELDRWGLDDWGRASEPQAPSVVAAVAAVRFFLEAPNPSPTSPGTSEP